MVERSKLSESYTCEFVKIKVVFEEDILFLESLIYVVGVNSSIAKGEVKVFGAYVIRRDLQ